MSRTALILIDIQNDYFDTGKWPVAKMQTIAGNAARLLERARVANETILHIRHEILADSAPFFVPGTPGAEIHASVASRPGEPVILKHFANAFRETSLRKDLEAAEVTRLVICGAMSQMCVDATTRAAADFGYEITVIEDACGAKELEFNGQQVTAAQVHVAFMAPLAMSYARVITTNAFLSETNAQAEG